MVDGGSHLVGEAFGALFEDLRLLAELIEVAGRLLVALAGLAPVR